VDQQAERFVQLFPSNPASFVQGMPTGKIKSTPEGPKCIFDYRNVKRPFTLNDARLHLDGKVSLVANPLLPNGTCRWGALDNDRLKFSDFSAPEWTKLILNFCPSKSGGIHAFLFLTLAWPADIVRRLQIGWARDLGWYPCEINPKQTLLTESTPHGNGINLPFFGAGVVTEPVLYTVPPAEMWKHQPTETDSASTITVESEEGGDDCGYWWDDALLALLTAYKKSIPGFDFHRCRRGYAVPCPGNTQLGGWPDGAKHSTDDPLLSHESLVFIRNGWPKFRCFHAHCDGDCGIAKKTINDWRDYFDPGFVFFDVDAWLDAEAEKV
jgi:hypothetical protein